MNLSTIIGLVCGIGMLAASAILAGGFSAIRLYLDLPSLAVVFGGSLGAMIVSYGLSGIIKLFGYMRFTFFPQSYNIPELIVTVVSFAEKSRREGILSLEDDVNQLEDPFIKKGLQLIVDGTDSELVRRILEAEVDAMMDRHDVNKKMFEDWGAICPSFGMMGTFIALVMMLANLDDRANIGPAMSLALITSLYGAMGAYIIFNPMAYNLNLQTSKEIVAKTVV